MPNFILFFYTGCIRNLTMLLLAMHGVCGVPILTYVLINEKGFLLFYTCDS